MKKVCLLTALLLALLSLLLFASAQEEKIVVLPAGVTEIGDEAFSGDISIVSVVIPSGVTISDNAFSGCENIKTLIVLSDSPALFEKAFSTLPIEHVYCAEGSETQAHYSYLGVKVHPLSDYTAGGEFLTEVIDGGCALVGYTGKDVHVEIPSSVRGLPVITVGDRAFYQNETIVSVTVPEYVSSIGRYAFYGCRALETIELKGSIEQIGDYAFQNARNIKSINLGKNTRLLGENPFLNCAMLTSVNGLEENARYSFSDGMIIDNAEGLVVSYLTNLQQAEITVPVGVTSVGKYAFSYAQTLSSVTFSETVETVSDYAFFECPSLHSVFAKGVLKEIGASAFENCERLTDFPLEEGLVHVGDYAFRNCRSLLTKTLPQSVESAGTDVFHVEQSVTGTVMNIVPLYQFHYNRTICVIRGEEKSVKTSGCGATCVAMIIRYMNGDYTETPETVFEWMYETGYYKGDGLSHLALSRYLSVKGIGSRWTSNTTEVLDALRAGKPVIAHMGKGTFADKGHYILLRGIDENGNICVNDPNSRRLTSGTFSLSMIKSELKVSNGFCIIK